MSYEPYEPGSFYRMGWDDRMNGLQRSPNTPNNSLFEEYMKGYNDCHMQILETEKQSKRSTFLHGHPLYKEAHEVPTKTFLVD